MLSEGNGARRFEPCFPGKAFKSSESLGGGKRQALAQVSKYCNGRSLSVWVLGSPQKTAVTLVHSRKLASTRRLHFIILFVCIFLSVWVFIKSRQSLELARKMRTELSNDNDLRTEDDTASTNYDNPFERERLGRHSIEKMIVPPPIAEVIKPEPMSLPQAEKVSSFSIPRAWNRYDLPWFLPSLMKFPKSLEQASFRVIYAPTKVAMSDGLGHSMTALNYELLASLHLGIAYSHRRSSYSSLTASNANAVEDFFGWGDGYIRRETLQDLCIPPNSTWPTDPRKCVICERVKTTGPFQMRHLVNVPLSLVHLCTVRHGGKANCKKAIREFLARNNRSRTIFQLPTSVCEHPTSNSDLTETKGFFFAHYWRRHGLRILGTRAFSELGHTTRTVRFDERKLNIAVHVRRGDFLLEKVQRKRGIVEDRTFAKILVNVLAVINDVDGPFQDMPVVIHIYSEGEVLGKTPLSTHMTEIQTKQYFDSKGRPRGVRWWKKLLKEASGEFKRKDDVNGLRRIRVRMHISEDTLTSLHEMVAADVFVGSRSGLSNQLVWALSRGISVVPLASTNGMEQGKRGFVCCSVPYAHDTGVFDLMRFKRYWEAYSVANGLSAERAVSGSR